ncbi:hypothetical protein EVA_17726 [gut metagenome]|uniref:Uncharacterized protein n=1 Tax=gut metagenome TaxID=749906 RepID=J9FX58_9ZZZZ
MVFFCFRHPRRCPSACKHKPTSEPKSIGEYLQFNQSLHFIDTVIEFFKRLLLLRSYGIV